MKAGGMSKMFDLMGKVAVVTGSTRGIGRAIAEGLARAGAKVVISSRNVDKCDEVASDLLNEGLDAHPVPCHIGKKGDLERLVSTTQKHFGPIDCLVCNAAINPYYGPLSGLSDEIFEKMVGTNLHSKLRLCNMVLPQMAERGGGSVIIISSITAFQGSLMLGMYSITKAADIQLVRNLAVEWGPKHVRVNCIAPGLVRTDFARALWDDPGTRAQAEQSWPLRRLGEPEDMAGAAIFLAAPGSSWMTGQTIVIDGGVSIMGS
jgi:NAD(P)-dependent dehydrogenase (short-subunit alcohol dehydrogenase family)